MRPLCSYSTPSCPMPLKSAGTLAVVFGGASPARLGAQLFPARQHVGMGLVIRADAESAAPFTTDSSSKNSAQAGEGPGNGQAGKESLPLPSGDLVYEARNAGQRAATSFRLIFALPWRRFKKGSVLQLDVRLCSPLFLNNSLAVLPYRRLSLETPALLARCQPSHVRCITHHCVRTSSNGAALPRTSGTWPQRRPTELSLSCRLLRPLFGSSQSARVPFAIPVRCLCLAMPHPCIAFGAQTLTRTSALIINDPSSRQACGRSWAAPSARSGRGGSAAPRACLRSAERSGRPPMIRASMVSSSRQALAWHHMAAT